MCISLNFLAGNLKIYAKVHEMDLKNVSLIIQHLKIYKVSEIIQHSIIFKKSVKPTTTQIPNKEGNV